MPQPVIRTILLIAVMLSAGVRVSAQEDGESAHQVTIVITSAQMTVGEPALIDVLMECPLNNCAAVDIELQTDPAFLELTSLTPGDFPIAANQPVFVLRQELDPQNGSAHLIYVTQAPYDAASGSPGVLLQLGVRGLQPGEPVIQVTAAQISDFNGVAVDVAPLMDTTQRILPPESQPATLTLDVQVEARTGDSVQVTGDETTTVSIEVPLDTETAVVQLSFDAQEASAQGEVILSAPGHLECTLSRIEMLNRQGTESVIRLSAGDANADGAIDDADAAVIRSHDPVNGDINGDHSVNVLDLIHTGRNFGMVEGECQ